MPPSQPLADQPPRRRVHRPRHRRVHRRGPGWPPHPRVRRRHRPWRQPAHQSRHGFQPPRRRERQREQPDPDRNRPSRVQVGLEAPPGALIRAPAAPVRARPSRPLARSRPVGQPGLPDREARATPAASGSERPRAALRTPASRRPRSSSSRRGCLSSRPEPPGPKIAMLRCATPPAPSCRAAGADSIAGRRGRRSALRRRVRRPHRSLHPRQHRPP